jgi:UDP-2,3-diacylglucosamine pyrophosphatase LpxH
MRLAIVSDLHLGDPVCALAASAPQHENVVLSRHIFMDKFKKATRGEDENGQNGKKNDYLVLLGDIFDPSVAGYTEAYRVGRIFFQKVKEFDIADEIIYIPGNHR